MEVIVIRYVIEMRNGDYMVQNFKEGLDEVKISTVDHPIDAMLLRNKKIAQSVIKEILSGVANLPVEFDEDNPPAKVVELEIDVKLKTME